jgi:hypothetical protein
MIVSLFSSIIILLGQTSTATSGMTPYVFELEDGTPNVHGLVFKTEVNKDFFDIYVDEPWKRSLEKRPMKKTRIMTSYPEPSATYRKRMSDSWKENGGVLINGGTWVLQSELDLAMRADVLTRPQADVVAVAEPESEVVQDESNSIQKPGFLAQWGLSILIGAVALALNWAFLWWGFFKRSWQGIS